MNGFHTTKIIYNKHSSKKAKGNLIYSKGHFEENRLFKFHLFVLFYSPNRKKAENLYTERDVRCDANCSLVPGMFNIAIPIFVLEIHMLQTKYQIQEYRSRGLTSRGIVMLILMQCVGTLRSRGETLWQQQEMHAFGFSKVVSKIEHRWRTKSCSTRTKFQRNVHDKKPTNIDTTLWRP